MVVPAWILPCGRVYWKSNRRLVTYSAMLCPGSKLSGSSSRTMAGAPTCVAPTVAVTSVHCVGSVAMF